MNNHRHPQRSNNKYKTISNNNNLIELTIDSMSSEGQGVARDSGFVYFVDGAVTGETVLAKIIKRKKSFAICKVHKIIQPTQYLNPDYEKYRDIQGGCSIFRLSYEQQLIEKHNVVKQAFAKIARLSDDENSTAILNAIPIHASPQVNRYRNKAIYPAGINSHNEVDFGYYQQGSHQIVFTHDSILEHRDNAQILQCVKNFINHKGISAYNPQKHRGLVRSVLIRSNADNEYMVCLVLNAKDKALEFDWEQEFANALQTQLPQVTHIGFVYNSQRTPVQLSSSIRMLTLTPFYDYLENDSKKFKFEISANAFFQINRPQAEKIYQRVVELADIQSHHTVWDIYCGVGSITAFLAQKAGKVKGNEIVASAVENAKRNMQLNAIDNVEFAVGVAEKVIPAWLKQHGTGVVIPNIVAPDVVVLDPPRKGADTKVLEAISTAKPQRIVYVSCKPSTLARDVAYLQTQGYTLTALEAYDFFPHTMHIESVALLERK